MGDSGYASAAQAGLRAIDALGMRGCGIRDGGHQPEGNDHHLLTMPLSSFVNLTTQPTTIK
ncbi:MAG: hypothetical protein H0U76_28985 [Ktedonobacteraceae bacterium]|nr:hypothetical protein [Ktedonobacteraceae bacterium]